MRRRRSWRFRLRPRPSCGPYGPRPVGLWRPSSRSSLTLLRPTEVARAPRQPRPAWSQFWSHSPASVPAVPQPRRFVQARINVSWPASNGHEQNSKAWGRVEGWKYLDVKMSCNISCNISRGFGVIRGHWRSLTCRGGPPSRMTKPQVSSVLTCGFGGVARGGVEPPTFRFSGRAPRAPIARRLHCSVCASGGRSPRVVRHNVSEPGADSPNPRP